MSTRSPSAENPSPGASILILNWLGTTLTYVLSSLTGKSSRGPFWRVAAALTFREIKKRHAQNVDIAEPYVRLERFFAHDSFYVERFNNLVTGETIFINFLKSDWFLNLPITERITVTSLFRRVESSENIIVALNRRPLARENLGSLQNVDQDSLPQNLFIKEEPHYTKSQDALFGVRRALLTGPANLFDFIVRQVSKIFSVFKGGFIGLAGLILSFLVLPFMLLDKLGLKTAFSTNLRAAATRRKLGLLIKLKAPTAKISKLLSHYEMKHGHSESAVKSLGTLIQEPFAESILTPEWLNSTPLEHRVFVTSILRKASKLAPHSTNAFSAVAPVLNAKNQRNIPQITGVSPQQKEELQLFKKIKHKNLILPTAAQDSANQTSANQRPKPDATFSLTSSEDILRKEGWASQSFNGLDLFEIIKSRSFGDIEKIVRATDIELTLPAEPMQKLASLAALIGSPVKSTNPNFASVPPQFKVTPRNFESDTHLARLRNTANASLLSYEEGGELTLRLIWMRLANNLDDQVELSQAVESLCVAYDAHPLAKVTLRSVSFDTFLLLDLEEIIERMKMWIEWDNCGRSSLVALAHLATLTQDGSLFEMAVSYLEAIRGVPRAFMGSLKNSYLSIGIHGLDTVISGDVSSSEPLETLAPDKKYLCLVEGGAGIRALRKLKGLSENVTCAPVIPTDAPRFPSEATLKYIDDLIPKYSKRDMELAFEIDALVETYIQEASNAIRNTGVDNRYAEAVEIAHAILFFGIYQEALAIELCETLLKDAKSYDGVIFLINSANVIGTLIPEAEGVFGRENVFIGLESERSKGFDVAIKNIRESMAPRKAKVAAPVAKTSNWESNFSKWVSTTMSVHEKSVLDLPEEDYALLTLEHVNGYFDSYVALTEQSLKHMDVELFTSRAHPRFNDYITEGSFDNAEYKLTQCALSDRALPATEWTPGLTAELDNILDGVKNPWLPKYETMIHKRATSILASRLPQIFEAVSYFRARFSYNRPEYVFTGPNQHTISRAASYAALGLDIPVYDFLILASTHHPRYRYPVAKYSYIYDPWYRDIFEDYMRMPADSIRVSGPLFDYGQRLNHSPAPAKILKNKTHIVFFSQSGNFLNSCNMLEGICKASKGMDNIFITVKMHPHESPANLKRYKAFAEKHGAKDNLRLIHQGDAVALINEADLVVQSFSNVGLDALLMKTPVITFKPPSDLKARIFLYEKDIGFVVKTKAALAKKVKKFLSDPEDKKEMQKMAETFAAENEHFLRPDNAERVMSEVLQDIGKSPSA